MTGGASSSLSRSRERVRVRARALRTSSTDAEALLWHHLRDRRLAGYKFRRQRPIGAYFADFACLESALVVELDGGRGIVEQRAIHPSGDAVSSCANATSSDWYFADGFTVDGGTEQMILSNPFPQAETGETQGLT